MTAWEIFSLVIAALFYYGFFKILDDQIGIKKIFTKKWIKENYKTFVRYMVYSAWLSFCYHLNHIDYFWTVLAIWIFGQIILFYVMVRILPDPIRPKGSR